jgi:arylsulfatase A-like enzyme/Flp pilus assembly protein TadD
VIWFVLGWGCSSAPPINVLVVTLDTTRADRIGAYAPQSGLPSPTPHLDALASTGVRFDRAYTVTPLTIPAHSSLHTGLLPPRHQVRDNGDAFLSEGALTLAERLHERGWQTMASVGAEVTSHHWGFAQGFDAYFDDLQPVSSGSAGAAPDNRWRVERPGEQVVDDALRWLSSADPERPWFAWVHLFDAHFPYAPPEPYRSQWRLDPYRGELAYVDAQVGELLAGLPPGVAERTWVFVLSDHGESLGEHGEGMHGVLLYDATTRIPLLVRPPAQLGRKLRSQPGQVVAGPVSLVDLHPTIASLAGLPASGIEVDGFDLSGIFLGDYEPPSDRGLYAESMYGFYHYGWAPQRAWVDGQHKLIDSTTPELYARGDVAERQDLAGSQPALQQKMEAELEAYAATLQPASSVAAEVHLSAEQTAQLAALGYVTGTEHTEQDAAGPLPDPVRRLPVLGRVDRARQALMAGELELARSEIEAVIEAEPTLVDPKLMLASVKERTGDHAGAIALLEELLEQRRSSRVLTPLGTAYLRRGELDLAKALLAESKDLDPYLVQTWHAYLGALLTSGDPTFGVAVQEAAQRLPEDTRIRGFLALDAALRGGSDEVIEPLRAAIALGPVPLFQLGLGLALRADGQEDAAEDALLEEIRLFPPAVAARRALVTMYVEQQRYEEQLDQLDAILHAEEPSVDSFHSRAQVLFNLGRYAEAKVAVDECRRFSPTYPACAMLDANVLSKLGRKEEAQKTYEEALALAGKSPK